MLNRLNFPLIPLKLENKAPRKKSIDLVILIDGTKTNKFFYESIKESIKDILKKLDEENRNVYFMFGAVIYRNFAVSQKMTNCKEKLPIVLNLTESIDKVESFFNDNKTIASNMPTIGQAVMTQFSIKLNGMKIQKRLSFIFVKHQV